MISERYELSKRSEQTAENPVYTGFKYEFQDFKKFHPSMNLYSNNDIHAYGILLATITRSAGSRASLSSLLYLLSLKGLYSVTLNPDPANLLK